MFLINVTYKKDLAAVDAHLAAHRAHLARAIAAGTLLLAGRKNPRTGGLMLVKMKSRKEVDDFIAGDAFFTEGVADYEVTELLPTAWDPALASLVSSSH